MKKYICVAKCPELDYDNSKHCVTKNPTQPFPLYDYDCPCGNCPIWQEITQSTEKGGADGNEEGNNNRDIIESHGNVHAIFKQQAKSQIDYQKDGNRQQRDGISFFHGSFS